MVSCLRLFGAWKFLPPSLDFLVSCAQQFVDACFERVGSTQRALRLLRQFRAVLGRESSRAHLDEKYAAIFVRYTADLEGVRTVPEAAAAEASGRERNMQDMSCKGRAKSWLRQTMVVRCAYSRLQPVKILVIRQGSHSAAHFWVQIQKLYERHKQAPPLPRDAPPVAGNIMWARQLLRRIEVPMRTCVRPHLH